MDLSIDSRIRSAKKQQVWFWLFFGITILFLCLLSIFSVVMPKSVSISEAPLQTVSPLLLGICGMAGSGLRVFKLLKQEIADLTSGDSDGSSGDSPSTPDSVGDSAEFQDVG